MKLRLLILALILSAPLLGAEAYHGECRTTTGPVSASCSVQVFDGGTVTPSSLFSDSGLSTPLTNPFTAGSNGRFTFYAADGQYDVVMSGGTPALGTVTISDVSLGTGGAHPVDSVFGRTGAVIATSGDYTAAQVTSAARTDANNNFGAFYGQMAGITTPAAPPANAVRFYIDSADNVFKVRKPNGDVISLEQGASVTNGTVTSVALTAPSIFSVAGSPITTSGTLALSLATQTANTVFAGPTTGSAAAPTFRALVNDDIPALNTLSTGLTASRCVRTDGSSLFASAAGDCTFGTVTSVAMSAPAELSVAGSPITSSGTLAVTWASGSANRFIATPSGGAGPYSGRAIVAADIPTLDASKIGTGTFANARISASSIIQHEASLTLSNMGGAVTSGQMPATTVFNDQSNTYTAAGQEFVPSATTAAANILCAALPSTPQTGDVACDSADSNNFKSWNGSSWNLLGGTHNLLSSTHSDTTAASVVRGDILTGQTATPSWRRLAIGAANRYVTSDGTDVSWGQVAFSHLSGAATLSQLPFGTANQVLGTNAGATAQEHKTLSVGTTGTDFAIAHAANSIVFNLPTASATNRGALSTSDWTTFNAKENALTFNSPLTRATNTIDLDEAATYIWTGYHNLSGGQQRWPETIVSSLPTCNATNNGKVFIVTDGDTTSDCTVGVGSSTSVCRCKNGTGYQALGGGSGAALDVQNNGVSISDPTDTLDFSSEFAVVESPTGTANVSLAGGGTGNARNYTTLFVSKTTVTVLGTEHNFNHPAILVQCYDSSVPKAWIEPNAVTINQSNYNVTITFSAAQSGECVLAASGGGVADSAYAGLYISASAATGPITSGNYTKLDGTYAFVGAGPDDFDEPVEGRLRYIGARTLVFNVHASASLSIDAAATARIRIARNGTTIADSQQNVNMATASVSYPISLHTQVGMGTNDYLEVFVDHDSGSDKTITADLLTLTATPATGTANNEGNPCWAKYTIDETDLTDADTSEDETLFACSQFCKIRGVVVKHSEAFTGGGLTAFTVSVGTASAPTAYTSAFDIFAAAADTGFQDTDLLSSTTMAAAGHSVIARFTSTTANVADATAGNVDIWVCSETIQ